MNDQNLPGPNDIRPEPSDPEPCENCDEVDCAGANGYPEDCEEKEL